MTSERTWLVIPGNANTHAQVAETVESVLVPVTLRLVLDGVTDEQHIALAPNSECRLTPLERDPAIAQDTRLPGLVDRV